MGKQKTNNEGLEKKVADLEKRIEVLEKLAGIGGVQTEDSSNPPPDPPPHH